MHPLTANTEGANQHLIQACLCSCPKRCIIAQIAIILAIFTPVRYSTYDKCAECLYFSAFHSTSKANVKRALGLTSQRSTARSMRMDFTSRSSWQHTLERSQTVKIVNQQCKFSSRWDDQGIKLILSCMPVIAIMHRLFQLFVNKTKCY